MVTDTSLQTASSTYTPTVIAGPTATADTSSGPYNTAQTKAVVTNDTAADGATLDATSVKLCKVSATADIAPNCTLTTLVIDGEGTYTVNSATGAIIFTPLATFTGTATPITYSVTDSLGQKTSTTYTPSVVAPPLATATPNTSDGANDTNQLINPLTNDVAGTGTTLNATTVKLCGPHSPSMARAPTP
jgi:CshA-type fibril repeat protein